MYEDLRKALRQAANAKGTASLIAVEMNYAADAIEKLESERDAAMNELDMLHGRMGGELPKQCNNCELWGKSGWSQYNIGYCESGIEKRQAIWSSKTKLSDPASGVRILFLMVTTAGVRYIVPVRCATTI